MNDSENAPQFGSSRTVDAALEGLRTNPSEMRSLCRFAAGMSHELNNLLNVINSNASELMADRGLPDQARSAAKRIAVAGERATNLTSQVLLFSGQHPCWTKPLEMNAFLEESQAAWQRQLGPAIKLTLTLSSRRVGVSADRELLNAMVSILVANATDAIRGSGEVSISLGETLPENLPAKERTRFSNRRWVHLQVKDNGEGISAAVMAHIYEPFFTTRSARARLGLGLSVVKGVVDSHEGWLNISSKQGQGTTVDVLFPRIELAAPTKTPAAMAGAMPKQATILLVEDDALLRETTADVLRHGGYRVLQAESVEDARETWHWHAERIRLLLTDVVLPGGTSGLDIAAEFFSDNPALKVICTSGFSHEIMQRLGDLPEGWLYLPKPCLPPDMLSAVEKLLDP